MDTKETIKSKVSERALLARINRRYRHSDDASNTWVMRKTRASSVGKWGIGQYSILDTANSSWVEPDVSLEAEGRHLGVLRPYEELA